MKLTFIRHTAVDVPQGTCYGQTDVPLKDSFKDEATQVFNEIKDEKFDAIYCSPLSRCVRLAEYCNFKNIIYDDRLKELNFGNWEMRHWSELSGPIVEQWFKQWIDTPTDGGESFSDLYNRVGSFIEEIRKSNAENIVIFAHGGVISCARVYLKDVLLEDAFATMPEYGGIVRIEL